MFDMKWPYGMMGDTSYDCVQPEVNNFCAINLVDTPTSAALLQSIARCLGAGMGFAVATLNLDHVVKLRSRPGFLAAYLKHSYVVADGSPVVWLRRLAGSPVEKVTGADLVDPLMALAAERGTPVGFLGSTQATLDAAAALLEARYPGLRVVARVSPPFGLDPNGAEAGAALEALKQAGVRLCLVSLGAPKQEILAVRGLAAVPGCGFVSVGAALDFIAGHQRRAPRWMRRMALEWLWRMLDDPRRLTGRYLACFAILPGLTWQALQQRRARRSA
jgi:exopolysaccharide biosynthesis WecB/TagA/CpsF family protein